jgi:hypothetical protein
MKRGLCYLWSPILATPYHPDVGSDLRSFTERQNPAIKVLGILNSRNKSLRIEQLKKAILILTALTSLITVSCSASKASGPAGRKVVQISTSPFKEEGYRTELYVYALCDDGTLWVEGSDNPMNVATAKWTQVQTQ